MNRTKIDYGIDLGTTNSVIARMEKGKPVIKKTDLQMDTLPSCIQFNKKRATQVGGTAFNALKHDRFQALRNFKTDSSNTFIEFKRTMGTDKTFVSSHMQREFSSEELSAEVLKMLKSFVKDDEVRAVVITVPAKFTTNQKDATTRAASLAGFAQCELLQEPIAASMAYGMQSKVANGYFVVFDLGGGTFDAALVRAEDAILTIVDTEGDNYLGGKNIDYAIVDEVLIPYLVDNFSIRSILEDSNKKQMLRDALKFKAEEAKIQLSFRENVGILTDLGEIPCMDDLDAELELDVSIGNKDIADFVRPIFQRAIDKTKSLLERNNLRGTDLRALVPVGGPTYSPIIREMLREQITPNIDLSVDPMTAIAEGAALYASTIPVDERILSVTRDNTKLQLSISYEPTTVEEREFVTVKLAPGSPSPHVSVTVFVDLVRGDNAWSSGRTKVTALGELFEPILEINKANVFQILAFDERGSKIECEPSEFTIIQGTKIKNAILPYHFGVEIANKKNNRVLFEHIPGLKKNTPIPAKGIMDGLRTQKDIRPGLSSDWLKVPIYQGDHDAEGSRAIYNEHVYDWRISGEDLPALLPAGSEVIMTVEVDSSERISLHAFFPQLEHTVSLHVPTDTLQKEIDEQWLEWEISKAEEVLTEMTADPHGFEAAELDKLNQSLDSIKNRFEQGRGDYDCKKEVLNNLRQVLRATDALRDGAEWPKLESELKGIFSRLEGANKDLGNEKTSRMVETYRKQVDQVIREKNTRVGTALNEEIDSAFFALTFIYQLVNFVQYHDAQFESLAWKDRTRARQLLNQALTIISEGPTTERLHPVVMGVIDLMPENQKPDWDNTLLTK